MKPAVDADGEDESYGHAADREPAEMTSLDALALDLPADDEPIPREDPVTLVDKVWGRLRQRPGLELAELTVAMERDMVCVSGRVANDTMRRRIVDCVSTCGGVRVIRNRIRLVN